MYVAGARRADILWVIVQYMGVHGKVFGYATKLTQKLQSHTIDRILEYPEMQSINILRIFLKLCATSFHLPYEFRSGTQTFYVVNIIYSINILHTIQDASILRNRLADYIFLHNIFGPSV